VEEYVQGALMVMRERLIEVELLFSKKVAAWMKDKLWHSSQELCPHERPAIADGARGGRACGLGLGTITANSNAKAIDDSLFSTAACQQA
jgi:hypothetical protein